MNLLQDVYSVGMDKALWKKVAKHYFSNGKDRLDFSEFMELMSMQYYVWAVDAVFASMKEGLWRSHCVGSVAD